MSRHDSATYYDDCQIIGGSGSPEACRAPRAGAIVCQPGARVPAGRLTTTCLVNADCPEGFVCTYGGVAQEFDPAVVYSGVCERRCEDDRGCVRCDLECDVSARTPVCSDRRGPPLEPMPCVADCQCTGAQGGKCLHGFCADTDGVVGCGPGQGCECEGGTCGEDRCCHRADGSIVGNDEPECRPDLY